MITLLFLFTIVFPDQRHLYKDRDPVFLAPGRTSPFKTMPLTEPTFNKLLSEPGDAVQAYNPSTLETEAGGPQV